MNTLKIAWRNIWRNKRRTLLNMCAVGFGLMLLLFAIGIMNAIFGEAQNDLGNAGIGHVELYADGYRVARDAGILLEDADALAATVADAAPPGSRVGTRVIGDGLVATAWASRGVTVHGVDPAVEATLSAFFTDIRQGEGLAAGDARGILLGVKLAEKLRAEVGSKVRLMVQRADGEMGANLFRVRGLFGAMSPTIAEGQVFVTADAARTLMGIERGAHEVLAQLPRMDLADPLVAVLKAQVRPGVEVLGIGDLLPELKAVSEFFDQASTSIVFGLFLLVGLGIFNTWLMSVLERTREFGVMMAVGTSRGRLMGVVLGEAFWVATLSVLLGLVVGVLLNWSAAEFGYLDWRQAMNAEGMDFAGTTVGMQIRPALTAAAAARTTVIVWVLTLLVGIYPAWRASRLQPAVALRSA